MPSGMAWIVNALRTCFYILYGHFRVLEVYIAVVTHIRGEIMC
jgi:hypothetical protein